RNFDIRKQLLEYDDVANDQRRAIYSQRNDILDSNDINETINIIREDVINTTINAYISLKSLEEMWNIDGLQKQLINDFSLKLPIQDWFNKESELYKETLHNRILEEMIRKHKEKEKIIGSKMMRNFEKGIMLQTLDTLWKEHLSAIDYLRQGIHLRGYAQKDPKQEYKRESFSMFSNMLEALKYEVITTLSKIEVQLPGEVSMLDQQKHQKPESIMKKHQLNHGIQNQTLILKTEVQSELEGGKIGRNEFCPCGSGKKYKHCHGKFKLKF
ncbi:MAG: SEC-C metal-binding domain-containing protein, partial [Arsenophonus sp. ET-DL12-MAG3]